MSNYGAYRSVYKDEQMNKPRVFYTQSLQEIKSPNENVMTQFNQYLSEYQVVVVKIWAEWCQPCKQASERLNTIIQDLYNTYPRLFETKGHIIFLDDDIDSDESIHKEKVNAIPNFFIYSSLNQKNIVQSFTNLDFQSFEMILREICDVLYRKLISSDMSPSSNVQIEYRQ